MQGMEGTPENEHTIAIGSKDEETKIVEQRLH
jgi:hypothetical protein